MADARLFTSEALAQMSAYLRRSAPAGATRDHGLALLQHVAALDAALVRAMDAAEKAITKGNEAALVAKLAQDSRAELAAALRKIERLDANGWARDIAVAARAAAGS